MKKVLVIFSFLLTQGLLGAHQEGGFPVVQMKPYEMPEMGDSISEVKEIEFSKKEMKKIIHEHKKELRDTLKAIKEEYTRAELNTIKKEIRAKGNERSAPEARDSKKKMWIWLAVMIPLSILTTVLLIILGFVILEFLLLGILSWMFGGGWD